MTTYATQKKMDEMKAEIERLRAENEELKDVILMAYAYSQGQKSWHEQDSKIGNRIRAILDSNG